MPLAFFSFGPIFKSFIKRNFCMDWLEPYVSGSALTIFFVP